MTFKDLAIIAPILKSLEEAGYSHPTPIQEQSIPILLEGRDLLGCAQTGTGKTAAFAIPILQHLYKQGQPEQRRRKIRALVMTPTRELAIQIADSFTAYGNHTGLRNTVVFGGVKQGAQVQALKRGVDVLIATPGRLLDLISQGHISLRDITHFVLDEADQMLDMGFIRDIRKLIDMLPTRRQSLFFSATMSPEILALSRQIVGDPERVTIKPEQPTAERVEQAVYMVEKKDKGKLLVHLIEKEDPESVLVFSRTKHGADKIVRFLSKSGIKSAAIHGNKSQVARQKALGNFKDGITNVLVATDIAARGIDVSLLELVVNFDLPNVPETYVHRIGRTGRAKASGTALSFCDMEERAYLRSIQKLIKQDVPVVTDHPYVDDSVEPAGGFVKQKPKQQPRSNRRHGKGYRVKTGPGGNGGKGGEGSGTRNRRDSNSGGN